MFPTLSTFTDIYDKSNQQAIIDACENNPIDDHVYHFVNPGGDDALHKQVPLTNMVFAGSSALNQLIHMWTQPDKVIHLPLSARETMREWRPSDVDTFFLGMPCQFRQKLAFTDLVHVKEKTPEELLMHFDLPCCRVAINTRYDIWVSAHALYAVMTGKYYLPLYLKTKESFSSLLAQHKANPVLHDAESYLYERFTGRVDKYKKRGFTPEWVVTRELVPWVKERFVYAEWKVTHKDEQPKTDVDEAIAKLTAVLQDPEAKKAVLDLLSKITGALSLNEKPVNAMPDYSLHQSCQPPLTSFLNQLATCKAREDYVTPVTINSSQLPSLGCPGVKGSYGAPGPKGYP